MSWWDTAIQVSKVAADASAARDERKRTEAFRAAQLKVQADANTALAKNDFATAATLQGQASRMAYASTSSPAPLVSSASVGSAFDQYLPFIIIGVIGLGAFSVLRK